MQTQNLNPTELRQLIQTAFYNAWESGVHNGQGKSEASREYGIAADKARAELFAKLGIKS